MKTICLIGGNTLGHVIPGVSVGKMIRKKYPMTKVIYITSDKQKDLKVLKDAKFDLLEFVHVKSLNYINEIKMYFTLRKYFLSLFKKHKVDIVVGFGSFLSAIGVLTAQSLEINTFIHEQNKVLGLGNKLCSFKAKKILVNFDIPKWKKKKVVVGNPILVENKNLVKKNKLVITSGSGGSKIINNVMADFLNQYEGNLEITFITGKKYFDEVITKVKSKDNLKIVPFIDNLSEYLQDAKYVITRAGATTLSEVFELNIIPIIIPSPNVTNNHQYLNALEYHKNSIIILENELTKEKINRALKEIETIKPILNPFKINSALKFVEVINNVERLY